MAGLRPHLEQGPETYLVNEDIVGGTFVEPVDATSTVKKIRKAAAASTRVLGLAIGDAAGAAGNVPETTDAWGRPRSGGLTPPNEVAVAYRGSWWVVNTTGATLHFGSLLVCGANGTIAAAGATPAVGTVIAKVIEAKGIAPNAEGKIRLLLG